MQSLSNQEQDLFPHNKAVPWGEQIHVSLFSFFFFTSIDFDLFGFANFPKRYNEQYSMIKVKILQMVHHTLMG